MDGEQHGEKSYWQMNSPIFRMVDGRSLILTEVRHVPSLQKKINFHRDARFKGLQLVEEF